MYESLLESQDPVLFFRDAIVSLEQTNKGSYEKVVGALN